MKAEAVEAKTLGDDFSAMLSAYNAQWNSYTNRLNTFGGTADQQYYVAAMAIKAATDKATGAIVAGLGNPWNNSNYSICTPFGIPMQGGYHLVWLRDLFDILPSSEGRWDSRASLLGLPGSEAAKTCP